MINGTITINGDDINSELYKHDKLITSEFEKLLIIRDLVAKIVDGYEKSVQIGFMNEIPKKQDENDK